MTSFDTMDIIAYYLSECDMRAFDYLGYKTRTEGFKDIENKIRRDQKEYLKRLRDEFDAVTSSHRQGQWKREPRKRILDTKAYLSDYSFDELSAIVRSLIANADKISTTDSVIENVSEITEEELEQIINARDSTSRIEYRTSVTKSVRVYDHSIISGLKALYRGRCQLCGCLPLEEFEADISEAHHIEYYSETQNNDASNILILCPNHHSIIHKLNPVFNKNSLEYRFPDGTVLGLKLNYHINEGKIVID